MVSLALPDSIQNTWAAIHGSEALDFVLKEEVVEWLEDNEIALRLSYEGTPFEDTVGDWYDYTGHFECFEHAIIFKTRWF